VDGLVKSVIFRLDTDAVLDELFSETVNKGTLVNCSAVLEIENRFVLSKVFRFFCHYCLKETIYMT